MKAKLGRVSITGAVGLALLFGFAVGSASADRPFAPRFSANAPGDIEMAANTLMTCAASETNCSAAQAGTATPASALSNNNHDMVFVDVDGDPATFNSSRASLNMPAGSEVLFAGLYYGGRLTAGSGGSAASEPDQRDTVGLMAPGGNYQTLTADTVDDSTGIAGAYSGFADITDQVKAAGNGDYTVADVQAGTGQDRYAGWSIVIAYRNESAPARNLSIFDGLQDVRQGQPAVSIPISGFQTPATGPVRTELGFVAYEGDRSASGDSVTLNGQTVSDAANPPNNFFNSVISVDGVPVNTKDPDYDNQLGFDSIITNADDYLGNGDTDAVVRIQTNLDQVLPAALTFATDLFSPDVVVDKSVQDLNGGGVESGDILRYSVEYTNQGEDGADQFTARDQIPTGTSYVPGSLRVTAGPNAPFSPTDAVGDDLGEFLGSANAVRFRLGQGADQSSGGLITASGGAADSASVTFDVKVGAGLPPGRKITNVATAGFLSQTVGVAQSASSSPVTVEVDAIDLAITKTHVDPVVGNQVEFTIGVRNAGTLPPDGTPVTVTDQLPPLAFGSFVITASNGWDCSATAGLDLSCTRSDPLAPGDSYPAIELTATATPSPPATFSNTATLEGGGDSNPGNNAAVDFLPLPPALSDLQLEKTASPGTVASGGRIAFELTATNNGPSDATGVSITDSLPVGLSDVDAEPGQGSCPTISPAQVQCQLGNLASGGTATVTISARVDLDGQSDVLNNAEISGDQPDPAPNNNFAQASFDVAATADLAITKTASPDPVAGETFSYTIRVENRGPSAATGVVINDPLPDLFDYASTSIPGGSGLTCNSPTAGGSLACTIPSLAAGDSTELTINGTLPPASAGVAVSNTATVFSSEDDSDAGNDSSTVVVNPTPYADVSIDKIGPDAAVKAGQESEFRLIVSNNGPSAAQSVVATDPMPDGLEVISLPAGCSQNGSEVSCELGTMADGDSKTLSIPVRANVAVAGQTLTNRASASTTSIDPIPANNEDDATITISPTTPPPPAANADLKVTKKASTKHPKVGLPLTYTVVVSNTGPDRATSVKLTDTTKGRFDLLGLRPGAKCKAQRPVTCKLGDLAPGQSKSVRLKLRPRAPGSLVNTAAVSSRTPDLNPDNDRAKVRRTVKRGKAKVELSQKASRSRIRTGHKVRLTITLRNRGKAAAIGTTVCERLPAGLVRFKAPGAKFKRGKLCWKVSTLGKGRSHRFTVIARATNVPRNRKVVAVATANGTNVDPPSARKRVTVLARKARPGGVTG